MVTSGILATVFSKIESFIKANKNLVIRNVEIGDMPPEFIAIRGDIADCHMQADGAESLTSDYFLIDEMAAWCHKLRLRLWLENRSSVPIHVIGFNTNKNIIDTEYGSAIVFPQQGSITGEAIRFECLLDSDSPSLKLFEIEGQKKVYKSSNYYIDESIIGVFPGQIQCICILFYANQNVYEIKPSLVIEQNGRIAEIEIPLDRRALVCPASMIPPEKQYMRTFSREVPFVESNPELFQHYLQYE